MGPRTKVTGLLCHHVFTRQQLLGAAANDGRLSRRINKQTGVDLHKIMAKPLPDKSCHMTWFAATVFQFISSVNRLVLSSAPLLKQNGGGIERLLLSPPHCRLSKKLAKTFFSKAREANRTVQFLFFSFSMSLAFWTLKSAESSLQQSFLTADSEITPAKCHDSSFKKALIQKNVSFLFGLATE